jgi:hypothetical protein
VANTLAQNPTVQTYANATSVQKAFGSAGTNPSLYVAALTAELFTAQSLTSIVDDMNAGSYAADAAADAGANYSRAWVRSMQNTSTGVATVTATLATADYGTIEIFELTGAETSSALDAGNGTGGVGTTRSVSITTGTSNCSVIVAGAAYPADMAVDTDYTESFAQTAGFNIYHYGEYRVDAGAAGGITLTMQAPGNSSYWAMAVAAYKTAAAGGVTPNSGRIRELAALGWNLGFGRTWR